MRGRGLALAILVVATNALAQQFEIVHHFLYSTAMPQDQLLLASDGNVYGTNWGGELYRGAIFRLIPDGAGGFTHEELYSFHGPDGSNPPGVVQGADGRLYGVSVSGGTLDGGVVFAFDPSSRQLLKLHDFPGDLPWRLVSASDGQLYGVTAAGGAYNQGTLYRISPSGDYSLLHDFQGPDGAVPNGALIQASDGYLYGATAYGGSAAAPAVTGGLAASPKGGGAPSYGVLFRADLAGNVTVLHSFVPAEGYFPNGDLLEAPDGNLYGTTFYGGYSNAGSVYRSDKSGNVTVLGQFPSDANAGANPTGGLTLASDGNFYGVTSGGSPSGGGAVYRITSGGVLTLVASFGGPGPNWLAAGLTLVPDGTLLGIATHGGLSDSGAVFRVPLPDTGFEVVHEFGTIPGPISPTNAIVEAPDGTLWGTAGGGTAGLGTVFRLSGGSLVAHEFSDSDGAGPKDLLVAADGNFYGTTSSHGANGLGTIFRLDGSGNFTILHNFSGGPGEHPETGLIQASDGYFYGTTEGDYFAGTPPSLFRMDVSGNVTTLNSTDIFNLSHGRLVQASDGNLYGTDTSLYNGGGVYRSDLSGDVTNLVAMNGSSGEKPQAGLIQASDGNLYGTTSSQGAYGGGTVFRIDLSSNFTVVHDFNDGVSQAPLLQWSDGMLYGTINHAVFRLDLSGENYSLVHDLANFEGENLMAGLFAASDGMLYGTARDGGWTGRGVVYRIDVANSAPSITTVIPASGRAAGGVPVTISGDHFRYPIESSLEGPIVFDARTVFATSPALSPGSLYDVAVTNTDGQSATLPAAFFADFLDAPTGTLFHDEIEMIFRDGITAGCGGGTYCRDAATSRAQMAVFLLKGEHGAGYKPPACQGIFQDVTCPSLFADWIEQLAAEEITAGCGGGNYCPQGPVARDQGSVLLLKAEHGPDYVPPSCQGIFADVTCPSTYADWIEQLAAEGITSGCGNGNFCPTSSTTRGQMAAFLTKTLGLQ